MKSVAFGIDIGGTKISIVVGDRRGKILSHRVLPTMTGKSTNKCIQGLVENLRQIKRCFPESKYRFLGIGVGVPGAVDSKKGVVPFSPHLPGWRGRNLRRILLKTLRLPVEMANDANAAAIGEKLFGQGNGSRHFIYMTVSTGIGGGIVVQDQLLEGSGFVAGEVGHLVVVAGGEKCRCGKRGCLEAYASGTAIANYFRVEMKKKHLKPAFQSITRKKGLSAETLAELARKGDRLAIQAFRRAGRFLGIGIASLLNVFNPEKFILGGGVLKTAPPVFWRAMRKSCREQAWPEALKSVRIVKSKLRGRVGDLGALALVFDKKA